MTVYVEQDLTLKLTAVDEAGDPVNPSNVRFKVKDPTGNVETYTLGVDSEVTEVTSGTVYHLTVDLPTAGRWNFRAETLNASSEVVSVTERTVIVSASKVI